MPRMSGDDSEAIDRDQILMMQKLLNAAAEREQEERETTEVTETNADQKEGGTGTRAKGEEGSMGNPNTKDTGHKYGVQGPQGQPGPAHREAGRASGGRAVRNDWPHLDDGRRRSERADRAMGS